MEEDKRDPDSVIINIEHNEVSIKVERRQRQKVLIKDMFYDYATNTTLHGLSYTTKRGLTRIEKIFWIITFVASLCMCSYLINNVWIKWRTSPVIVTISETLVPVRQIPFPSVTICPQSKVKTSIYNYASEKERLRKILYDLDGAEFEDNQLNYSKIDDISQVCGDWRLDSQLSDVNKWNNYIEMFKYENTSTADTIIQVAPKREDIFVTCTWRGKQDQYCAETVTEVLTSEGLCYNINSLAAHDILQGDNNIHLNATNDITNWTMTEGYSYFGREATPYPTPGKEFGALPDLEIIFQDILAEQDKKCNTVNSGFNKVYIQHPADLPQSSLYYYAVRNGEVSSIALSYNIINTSQTLRKYNAEKRQCYFPRERYLKYFKIYTESNCMLECLSNITIDMCNCVGFYMPHESNETICTAVEIECINDAREELVSREASKDESACRCLPPCYSVEYQAEILKTNFNLTNNFFNDSIPLLYDFSNVTKPTTKTGVAYSKMEMFYKGSRFVSMHRSELFGETDFLANIGGLLSLFLGFSFLSLIELLYFLTLRLCCMLNKDIKKEKLQRTNPIEAKLKKF